MIKKIILTFSILTLLSINSYSAGTSSESSSKVKSDYDKAVKLIKSAKKYEKKDRKEKAKKRYEEALKLLLVSNSKKPNKADTPNYLGFTTRKLGDYKGGENQEKREPNFGVKCHILSGKEVKMGDFRTKNKETLCGNEFLRNVAKQEVFHESRSDSDRDRDSKIS